MLAFGKGGFYALQGSFYLQYILTGFHNKQIHISSQQALGLLLEGVPHGVKIDMPQGWQFGGGPHGTGHKSGLLWGAVGIGHLPGQFRSSLVNGKGLLSYGVFRQHQ